MPTHTPVPELDARFSSPNAQAVPWADVTAVLGEAEMFWLSTLRSNGRPHVVPLPAIWLDDALHFCTGPAEQKARNLAHSPTCVLSTGTPEMRSGLDVAVEGSAAPVTEADLLHQLAQRWQVELNWQFEVVPGGFTDPSAPAASGQDPVLVFRVEPVKVLAFSKGEPFSQTRYRFGEAG